MRYPILTRAHCAELAERQLEGRSASFGRDVSERAHRLGDGVEMNLEPLQRAALLVRKEIPDKRRPSELDQIEGRAAVHLYAALEDVPVVVLDDRGFWRWASFAYFWDFIAWREQGPFQKGNYMKYIDGESSSEAVLPRMYRRVAALGGADHAELAHATTRTTDFWRSHILRVKTSTAPALTRALVRFQARNQLKTNDIRELAKRLTRTWTNAVLNIYDDDEAEALIAELWDEGPGDGGPEPETTPAGQHPVGSADPMGGRLRTARKASVKNLPIQELGDRKFIHGKGPDR